MNEVNEKRIRQRPLIGLGIFILEMLFMLTLGGLIQHALGIWGTAVTELCMAIFAVGGVLLGCGALKEAFPFTPPPVSRFFGGAFMFTGVFFINAALSAVLLLLFPDSSGSSEAISAMITSVPPAVAILLIAVLPAVCEEALFRGLLIFSVRRFKPGWIIFISGVCFGIAHLDPVRFPIMFIMGAFLAYIDLKTDSLFLGVFFHFFNNLISTVLTILSSRNPTSSDPAAVPALTTVGSALTLTGLALAALLVGWIILNRARPKNAILIPLCIAVGISYVGGTGITFLSATTESLRSSVDSANIILTTASPEYKGAVFTVSEEDSAKYTYTCTVSAVAGGGNLRVTLSSDSETVMTLESGVLGQTRTLTLKPGEYHVACTLLPADDGDGTATATVVYSVIPVKT